jgi:nicotinate-nucleotide pyrophosphorylase (carboxylating)
MSDLTTKDIILMALKEDMPSGDVTTESLGLDVRPGIARLVAKQDLILSGRMVFEDTVWALEPTAKKTG